MTAEVKPEDWLDWHSGRTAQESAVRLALACSAVIPTDKAFQQLIEEQVVTDLVAFATHARRTMERRKLKSASLATDPLWPASNKKVPVGTNLWEALGAIIHAVELTLEWEEADMEPNPYKGRQPVFAGSVNVRSNEKNLKLPIGSLVAAFFGNVLNHSMGPRDKE